MMHRTLLATLLLTLLVVPTAWAQDSVSAGEPLSVVFTPRREAVLSAELFTKVLKIYKEMGQSFEQGDLLIQLDDAQLKLEVTKRQALAESAAGHYAVNQKLRANKSVSALDLQDSRRDAQTSAADLAMARRLIDVCAITAPFRGRVKQLKVREYESVKKGDPLISIVDDWKLFAKVLMPSTSFGKIQIGQILTFQVNQTKQTVKGKVSHINETLDPASSTFEVYAVIDNAEQTLRSGMSGRLLQ